MALGQRVFNNKIFLQKLYKARSDRARYKIVSEATTENILCIIEICANILHWRVPFTPKQHNKLVENAELLRKITRVRSEKSARKIILQKGSGLAVSAILAPIIFELAKTAYNKIAES